MASKNDSEAHSRSKSSETAESEFPVVGIGASAGGLEALKELFGNMPTDTGMAFVVITHHHPEHVSMLPDLMGRTTSMDVVKAEDGTVLEPDHVYVATGTPITIKNRTLHEEPLGDRQHAPLAVDLFFRSLARDCEHLGICIVLSGTGADGTIGLKAVKGAGGMAMVQETKTARYAGMPSSAIATAQADYVLPVSEMPAQLVAYGRNLTLPKVLSRQTDTELPKEAMQAIFRLLRSRTGHEFSGYKMSTLRRRIERRMNVHQLNELQDYVRFLEENPREIDVLFKEFLIGVTSFFRDLEAFTALTEGPLLELMKEREEGSQIRAWVTGCGTGEEAYTLAILLRETAEKAERNFELQVFATDLDDESIETARAGRYPAGIANDVPADKLDHYFSKEENSYRISKQIRDMVVFAPQNMISDPPFTRLDLVCCRNVLIYMNGDLQRRVLPIFHYALRRGGLLMLGSSETVGAQDDLFKPVDKKNKIYRRRETATPQLPELPGGAGRKQASTDNEGVSQKSAPPIRKRLAAAAEKLLLERFAPPSIVVDSKGEVIYIHGRTGKYLEPAAGEPPGNILDMAREGLRERLAPTLREAAKGKKGSAVRHGVKIKTNGAWKQVELNVTRIAEPASLSGLLLVTIQPRPGGPKEQEAESTVASGDDKSPADERVADLENELQFTKESLQTTVEELETSNEELKSTNEELQSTNEELQSANEELETSKEEMQSLNEELTTVNSELESKVEELADANSDMQNLLNSTNIATVFLDARLRIKRYTSKAKEVINVIDTDIGRPIGDLAARIVDVNLQKEAQKVLQTLKQVEYEVQSNNGKWYLMRMVPYRTVENVIDGVVITLVEIDRLKDDVEEGRDSWEFYESIFDTLREPVLILDGDLNVAAANDKFYTVFRISPKQTEGKKVYEINRGQWDLPELRELLEKVLPENQIFQDYELEGDFGRGGRRKLILNARKMNRAPGMPGMIVLAMEDVTGGG